MILLICIETVGILGRGRSKTAPLHRTGRTSQRGWKCAERFDVGAQSRCALLGSKPKTKTLPRAIPGLLLGGLLLAGCAGIMPGGGPAASWSDVPAILARIHAPEFPARNFPITDYGAKSGGAIDCTEAIRQAIAACHAAGGGHVVVPDGVFLTGAINLLSNVDLHLADNATLKFSTEPADYPLVFTRWEGTECMNYSAFIYAFEQQNIAVTGHGTLDGSASDQNWWAWTRKGPNDSPSPATPGRARLGLMGQQGIPVAQRVMGRGSFLRPNFVQPYRCRNVLIADVKIRNSPMWELNPVLCTNVIVRGVDINSLGPNNDGCDPESCQDVLIENCSFQTGDDCIAIKSGRNADGKRVGVASENLIIRGCIMKDGHGGVVIGSEISGDCRNVFVENCQMDSPHLERALRLKDNAARGGIIENIFMRKVSVGQVAEAILTVDFTYEEGANGPYQAVARYIFLEGVTSQSSPRIMYISGFDGSVIDQIHFKDCTFKGVTSTEVMLKAGAVTFNGVNIEPLAKPASLSSRPNVADPSNPSPLTP